MARILLANEFGDGFGHARRLLNVARELAREGHECLFALRDPVGAAPVLSESGFRILQAPYVVPVQRPSWQGRTVVAYGDILAGMGFDDAARLDAMVSAWDNLLALVKPDLVIADFSPLLCLALYPATKLVLLGNGYTLPPSEQPEFSSLREGERLVPEQALLETVARVQQRRGRPFPRTLPELLNAQARFVTTLPELDPYVATRETPAAGPLLPLPSPAPLAKSMDYFAYLSATYPGTSTMIEALAHSGLRGSIYLRDAEPAVLAQWRSRGLQIHERPVDLPSVLRDASVAIHHGGPATMEAALATGRRQLLVPRHFEQSLYARAALNLKVAVAMKPHAKFEVRHAAAALQSIMAHTAAAYAAADFAEDLAARGMTGSLDGVVEICATLLD